VATNDELTARFGDRFDQTVGDWMVANGSDSGGVPGYLGMRFTGVGPGWTTCAIDVTAELLNPAGAAHGAVVASLVDHVLGSTVIPVVPRGTWPATIEFKVNYLAPTREGELLARAEVVSLSSRTAVVHVECTSGGRSVATALGTVAIVPPKS
jgi:1,4-dihydroxy-2-naphthoyl-CoA hydrolase